MNPTPLTRRRCILRGAHLLLLVLCALGLVAPYFHAQQATKESAPPENLHLYLLIGEPEITGTDTGEFSDRCFILNDRNEWKPGAENGFVRKMIEKDKDIKIGLIVNAGGGSEIDGWLGKSELYWAARKRTKSALRNGTLKGVLWQQTGSDRAAEDGSLAKLQTLIGNLRADFNEPNLPFTSLSPRHN